MALILIVAVLLGLAAPWIQARMWGIPFSLLSIATVIRSFVGAALTVIVLGVVALYVLRTTPMDQAAINWVAGLIAGATAFLLVLSSARRMRELRGLSVLSQRLQESDARRTASAALDRLLGRVQRKDPQLYVSLVLMATGPLTQAAMWQEARERLRSLDDHVLTEPQAVLRNQALATCELQFDDVDAAQRVIDRIERPTEGSIEVWLVAMEALLMAVRGESERALAHLGGQDVEDNPSLRASHRLVHAHIYAERGDREAAEGELRALLDEAGRAGLERVLRPHGPASPLAAKLLGDLGQSG